MAKTPVSALHELCMKKKISDHYNSITLVPGKEYVCQLCFDNEFEDIVVKGFGRSKKEAKHSAANEAIKMIISSIKSYGNYMVNILDLIDVKSPYADRSSENYVRKLKDICEANTLPLPDYISVIIRGWKNDRRVPGEEIDSVAIRQQWHTMQCSVASLYEVGTSSTKKEARQIAARLMIEKIKNTLKDKFIDPPPTDVENSKNIKNNSSSCNGSNGEDNGVSNKVNFSDVTDEKENGEKEHKITFLGVIKEDVKVSDKKYNWKINMSDYHNIMKEEDFFPLSYAVRNKLKDISEEEIKNMTNAKTLLENICGSSDLKCVFIKYSCCIGITNRIFIVLELLSSPSWVMIGNGGTVVEAENNAVQKMLCYLKCLCSL